ncbi:MAG: signal peptidase I [Proteobacteria bacterium]|nr:signal peptidase I [Pseudomonadota bacterium]MCP4920172.1 signal peptidase I [Pseudomonadota bacterium]
MTSAQRQVAGALALVAIAVFLRAFVFGVVRVRTGSMEPTVAEGEVRLWSRLAEPVVGDIVVVRLPDEPDILHVKRLVAVGPGEVELATGRLYVNGQAIGEESPDLSWVDGQCRERVAAAVTERSGEANWTVVADGDHAREPLEDGEVWLLGDARRTSHDSRQWGALPRSAIVGVVTSIAWSRDTCEG